MGKEIVVNGVRIIPCGEGKNDVEFSFEGAVAYGEYTSPEVYSVDHSPDQEWLNIIASRLDCKN